MSDQYDIVVEGGDEYTIIVETSEVGPRGPQGIPGPSIVTEDTDTTLQGVLVADGQKVRPATTDEVVNKEAMQAALLAWLPALPRTMPALPNMAWIDGDVVKVSAAWVMTGGVWNDSGNWMDSQVWSDN